MLSKHNVRFMPAVLGLAIALADGAKADMIPILNAGFENPVLTNGNFTRVAPPEWTLTGAGGSFNPAAASFPGEAPEGQNTAYLHLGTLSQTLVDLLQPGVYTLQIDIGDSVFTAFPGYMVELLAGSVVLAKDDNTLVPLNGTFLTSTLVFAATASDPNLGQHLGIRLSSRGDETNFDDVRLNFSPFVVPEPSSVAMLITGALGLFGYGFPRGRNARHSKHS